MLLGFRDFNLDEAPEFELVVANIYIYIMKRCSERSPLFFDETLTIISKFVSKFYLAFFLIKRKI